MNLIIGITELKKWKFISSKEEYKTNFFSVEKKAYKLPSGKIVEDYYQINRSDYVIVVAINSKGEILVERNYRYGIDDFVLELPQGWIENNETALEAGVRELSEETGYVGQTEMLGKFHAQPGYINQNAFVVKITLDESRTVSLNTEEDENIEMQFLSINEINKLISQNKIKDMGMLSAIAMYTIKENKT